MPDPGAVDPVSINKPTFFAPKKVAVITLVVLTVLGLGAGYLLHTQAGWTFAGGLGLGLGSAALVGVLGALVYLRNKRAISSATGNTPPSSPGFKPSNAAPPPSQPRQVFGSGKPPSGVHSFHTNPAALKPNTPSSTNPPGYNTSSPYSSQTPIAQTPLANINSPTAPSQSPPGFTSHVSGTFQPPVTHRGHPNAYSNQPPLTQYYQQNQPGTQFQPPQPPNVVQPVSYPTNQSQTQQFQQHQQFVQYQQLPSQQQTPQPSVNQPVYGQAPHLSPHHSMQQWSFQQIPHGVPQGNFPPQPSHGTQQMPPVFTPPPQKPPVILGALSHEQFTRLLQSQNCQHDQPPQQMHAETPTLTVATHPPAVMTHAPSFHDLSSKINVLQPAIHYNKFTSAQVGELRKNVEIFLNNLGRQSITRKDNIYLQCMQNVPSYEVDWIIPQLDSISDHQIYSFQDAKNKFEITGQEVKRQLASYEATFSNFNGLTRDDLHKMLTLGYGSRLGKSKHDAQAFARSIVSEIYFFADSYGNIVPRLAGQRYTPTLMVTTNAPRHDEGRTIDDDVIHSFLRNMNHIIYSYLRECHRKGIDYPILLGVGMGVFLRVTQEQEKIIMDGFVQALENQTAKFSSHFKGFIFADPNPKLTDLVLNKVGHHKNSQNQPLWCISKKSSIDVAIACSQLGIKAALINPGDPSCVPGQYWESTKGGMSFALEELIALISTLLFQHPAVNPKVADKNQYVEHHDK